MLKQISHHQPPTTNNLKPVNQSLYIKFLGIRFFICSLLKKCLFFCFIIFLIYLCYNYATLYYMKTLFTVTSIVLFTVHFFGQTVSYDNVKSPRQKTINTSYEVGNTNASINVSSSGALVSSIPIYILPGTAGMQPSVSVNYNSQSGNGTMGMGWNVSAASSITRIPKTVYSHGKLEAIELSYNDTGDVSGLLTQSATT